MGNSQRVKKALTGGCVSMKMRKAYCGCGLYQEEDDEVEITDRYLTVVDVGVEQKKPTGRI